MEILASILASVDKLADAINNLADAYGSGDAAEPATRPTRRRSAKTEPSPAAAGSGDETPASGASASTSDAGSDAQGNVTTTAVDAGTGKVIEAEVLAGDVPDRQVVKNKGLELINKGGNTQMVELLRKHANKPDGDAPAFSAVPDSQLAALLADIEAALTMAG